MLDGVFASRTGWNEPRSSVRASPPSPPHAANMTATRSRAPGRRRDRRVGSS